MLLTQILSFYICLVSFCVWRVILSLFNSHSQNFNRLLQKGISCMTCFNDTLTQYPIRLLPCHISSVLLFQWKGHENHFPVAWAAWQGLLQMSLSCVLTSYRVMNTAPASSARLGAIEVRMWQLAFWLYPAPLSYLGIQKGF